MSYVDGFVIPVPKSFLEEYKGIARRAGEIWMEYGALHYVECIGDDVPYGTLTSFPRAVAATDDEVIIYSWITFPSRAERDAINAKVFKDPRFEALATEMKMDMQRMIYGGFEAFAEFRT